jgi:hypothetical protein
MALTVGMNFKEATRDRNETKIQIQMVAENGGQITPFLDAINHPGAQDCTAHKFRMRD